MGDIASIMCFVPAIRALDMLLSMLVGGVYPSNCVYNPSKMPTPHRAVVVDVE